MAVLDFAGSKRRFDVEFFVETELQGAN